MMPLAADVFDQFEATRIPANANRVEFDLEEMQRSFAQLVSELRGSAHRSYEDRVTSWAVTYHGLAPDHLREIAADPKLPPRHRFAALYGAHVLARRLGHLDELTEFDRRPAYADEHDIWLHLASMYHADGRYEPIEALQLAEQAYEKIREPRSSRCMHAGVIHNLACRVLDVLEHEDVHDKQRRDMVRRALGLARHAISLDPDYAKFHATLARALAEDGKYQGALDEIRTAIRRERGNGQDHVIRRSELRAVERRIQIAAARRDLDDVVDGIRLELGAVRSESLQLSGLLAGIVGLVVAAVQIVGNATPARAVATILAVAGTTAIVMMSANVAAMRGVQARDRAWSIGVPAVCAAILFAAAVILAR